MGLFEWGMNKLNKKLKEEFPEDYEQKIKTDEVEKASYSYYSYKNVKKLREKGKFWAIDVPYLQYPVTKQEKPRPLFIVFGIISLILLGFVGYAAYWITINMILPLVAAALQMNSVFNIPFWDIFGLFTMFTSIAPIISWILVGVVTALTIGMVVYFVSLTKRLFCLSKISMQEVAKGYEVRGMIYALGTIMAIVLVVGIFLLVKFGSNMTTKNIWIVIGVMASIVIMVGVVFTLLIIQRKKEVKLFNQLPKEQQDDYINHVRQLYKVHRRKKATKSALGSSDVDF